MPEPKTAMNILTMGDQAHLAVLCTMLVSLQENNPGECFAVYLVRGDLDGASLQRIARVLEKSGSALHPLETPEALFAQLPRRNERTLPLYCRIFAALYLPQELDRILYLDMDTIVLKPIRALYEMELGDKLFAAAPHIKGSVEMLNRLLLELSLDGVYLNTGVLLMNLPLLRQEQDILQAESYLKDHDLLLANPEKELFDSLYGKRTLPLDAMQYNLSERIYNMERNPVLQVSGITPEWVKENTVIFHYCGKNKPWNRRYVGQFDIFYQKYVRQAELLLGGERPAAAVREPAGEDGDDVRPLVSLIVPVFNAAGNLPRLLDSIVGQTYKELEILMVDDGSADGSLSILQDYAGKDSRLQVLRHVNAGVAKCRNLGLRQARGEYVMFAESGDWLERDAAERMVLAAETTGCELVAADYYRIQGRKCYQMGRFDKAGMHTRREYAALMMDNPADPYYGAVWNKLYRADILRREALTFPEHLDWYEDLLFNLEYLQFAEQVYISKDPAYYSVRSRGGFSGGSMQRKLLSVRLELFQNYKELYQNLDLYQGNQWKLRRFLVDFSRDRGQRMRASERLLTDEGLLPGRE